MDSRAKKYTNKSSRDTVFNLIERKQKKNNFKSGLHKIRVKAIPGSELIRCCVVNSTALSNDE